MSERVTFKIGVSSSGERYGKEHGPDGENKESTVFLEMPDGTVHQDTYSYEVGLFTEGEITSVSRKLILAIRTAVEEIGVSSWAITTVSPEVRFQDGQKIRVYPVHSSMLEFAYNEVVKPGQE